MYRTTPMMCEVNNDVCTYLPTYLLLLTYLVPGIRPSSRTSTAAATRYCTKAVVTAFGENKLR